MSKLPLYIIILAYFGHANGQFFPPSGNGNIFPPLGGNENNANTNINLKPIKIKLKDNVKDSKEEQESKILDKLRQVKSTEDFFKQFNLNRQFNLVSGRKTKLDIKGPILRSLTGGEDIQVAALAGCTPRLKPVDVSQELEKYDNLGYVFPKCISLYQCGGCCFSKELEDCVPTKFRRTTKNIFVIDYATHLGRPVPHSFIEHETCGCQCKVKEHHCTGFQVYKPRSCRCVCDKSPMTCPERKQWSNSACDCVCANHDPRCHPMKIWNKEKCLCECKPTSCRAGEELDKLSCYCVPKNLG